jgi:hypothetical protein
MSGSVTIRPGQTVQLPLTVDGDLVSGPTYTESNTALGTLTPNENPLTGAKFVAKLDAKGVETVTATGVGAGTLTDSVTITISPLARTLVLAVGPVSGP